MYTLYNLVYSPTITIISPWFPQDTQAANFRCSPLRLNSLREHLAVGIELIEFIIIVKYDTYKELCII